MSYLAGFGSALAKRPVLRAAVTSCCVMAAGDLVCQSIRARGLDKSRLDLRQTARFGLIGLTLHGPYFYKGFHWLDSQFGSAATVRQALVKTAVGQVTLFPVYVAGFFSYMGLLEGLTPGQCAEKLRKSYLHTLATGTVFWPLANVVNFMLVPPAGRIVYVNVAGLFWNAFLSYINTTEASADAIQHSDERKERW